MVKVECSPVTPDLHHTHKPSLSLTVCSEGGGRDTLFTPLNHSTRVLMLLLSGEEETFLYSLEEINHPFQISYFFSVGDSSTTGTLLPLLLCLFHSHICSSRFSFLVANPVCFYCCILLLLLHFIHNHNPLFFLSHYFVTVAISTSAHQFYESECFYFFI